MAPNCLSGAKIIFETIKHSEFLPENIRAVVYKSIQRNAYFAHCENIILAMLGDERIHIREEAVKRILTVRKATVTGLRKFTIPQLN